MGQNRTLARSLTHFPPSGPSLSADGLRPTGPLRARSDGLRNVTQVLRNLLPTIERTRIATVAEIEIDTLEMHPREDAVARNAVRRAAVLV